MTDGMRDAAVLYALGLLGSDEVRAFEESLKTSPELAELVNEYEAVAAVLSLSIEPMEAPTGLRESILQVVRGDKIVSETETQATPTLLPRPEAVGQSQRKAGPSPWLPWALAACFGILSAILFVKLRDSYAERGELVRANSIENIRFAILEAQTTELPAVSARVAWNEATGTGLLDAIDFPGQPSDKDYQLWIFDGDNPAPVSAGVFDPTSGERIVFTPDRTIGKAVAFAVSIETAGGNPQPAGPVILVGKPDAG